MYPLCHHLMPTGHRCQSPALKNSRLCYYHNRRQRPAAGSQGQPSIPFVFPENHDAVQQNLYATLLALTEGRITPNAAQSMIRICRAASANLAAAAREKSKRPGRKARAAKTIDAQRIESQPDIAEA